MLWRRITLLTGVIILLSLNVIAQNDRTCPNIVSDALLFVDTLCDDTSRNQACYGNLSLVVEPQSHVTELKFDAPGDIVNVADILSLTLSDMQEPDEWGVALMKLQANLPRTTAGELVTVLLMGDVSIEAAHHVTEADVSVTADSTVNVRGGPSTSNQVVGALASGEVVNATGRNEAGDWLRVDMPDGSVGWIAAFLTRVDGDLSNLNVVEVDEPVHRAMQAFYFHSGIHDAQCNEAPNSGILIQTPEGVGKVELTVNQVTVTLGSTAYLQAVADDYLYINLLEGEATVSAFDVTQTIFAGSRVKVAIDNELKAIAPPEEPEPYAMDDLRSLPVNILPEEIQIVEALTGDELAEKIADALVCRVQSDDTPYAYGGPGTDYLAQFQLSESKYEVEEKSIDNEGFMWYKIGPHAWVAEDRIEVFGDCGGILLVEAPPIPTPAQITDSSSNTMHLTVVGGPDSGDSICRTTSGSTSVEFFWGCTDNCVQRVTINGTLSVNIDIVVGTYDGGRGELHKSSVVELAPGIHSFFFEAVGPEGVFSVNCPYTAK